MSSSSSSCLCVTAELTMRAQPKRDYQSNDVVMTPASLAAALLHALEPRGHLLDPCAGTGVFVRALRGYGLVDACDTEQGGFSFWSAHVDWIVTNPPWSQFRTILEHALEIADHVALLATVNHWWTHRRVELVRLRGFGYERLLLVDPWPKAFPASGFQLGMMLVSRGYSGALTIETITGDW